MSYLNLTHANSKKTVSVNNDLIFSIHHSDSHKCTLVMGNGGAMIPVSESKEEILEKIKQLTQGELTK